MTYRNWPQVRTELWLGLGAAAKDSDEHPQLTNPTKPLHIKELNCHDQSSYIEQAILCAVMNIKLLISH